MMLVLFCFFAIKFIFIPIRYNFVVNFEYFVDFFFCSCLLLLLFVVMWKFVGNISNCVLVDGYTLKICAFRCVNFMMEGC